MTDINPTPFWANVRQLETNEFATGGANGNMNEQAKSLAARSELLKQYAALPYESKTGGYALNERVQLATGDIVRSTIASNVNNPNENMTGWADDKQPKNSLLSKSFSYSSSIHKVVEGLSNSLNDGDTLIIPPRPDGGAWIWDGQAVITKQINIDCGGVINAKFRDSSPHIIFRSPVDYTYKANDLVNSIIKGAKKLDLKTAFTLANLSEYFCVLTSTEIAIHRAGFAEDYTKNIVIDIVKNDGALRDPLPFGIDDLSKATLRLVKKRRSVTHKGLVINNLNTSASTIRGRNIYYEYASNIKTIDSTVNQGRTGMYGNAYLLNNSYNLSFENTRSISQRNGTDATYNIQIANAAYCSFLKCGCTTVGATGDETNIQRGLEGRHGYMITVDDCLFNGVDDHWGYDYVIKNSHLPLGVGIAGGSVYLENITGAEILYGQRQDTPYNDGTLTIKNCKPYNNLVRSLGHDVPIWTSKDYTKRKCFDVINIDGITILASEYTQNRGTADAQLILMRNPQLDETQVFRNTVLNISNVTIINDVPDISRIALIECWDEDTSAPFINYDNRRMCKEVNFSKIKVLFTNGAPPSNSGIPPVCEKLTIDDCTDLVFYRNRAKTVNVKGGSINNVGTTYMYFDCENMRISNLDAQYTTARYAYAALASRYYATTRVRIDDSDLPSQSWAHTPFTSQAAGAAGMNLISAYGNTYKNYDLATTLDNSFFVKDLRQFNKDRVLRHTLPSAITLEGGKESAVFTAAFEGVRAQDIVLGKFEYMPSGQNLEIVTIPNTTEITALSTINFKIVNKGASPVTIATNRYMIFRMI